MGTNCKPGDLAVVIAADHPANLGRIVRVLRAHDGHGQLAMKAEGPIWEATCAQPMVWTVKSQMVLRNTGPVPDKCLRPIRGEERPGCGPRETARDRCGTVGKGEPLRSD